VTTDWRSGGVIGGRAAILPVLPQEGRASTAGSIEQSRARYLKRAGAVPRQAAVPGRLDVFPRHGDMFVSSFKMGDESSLKKLLLADKERSRILALVQSLELPDCWVGAGFLRNAVWDHLHGRPPSKSFSDVDVIWFDSERSDPAIDVEIEVSLRRLDPSIDWSVKNQGRMHIRNGDKPYDSAVDAMRFWPETATAVAVRKIDIFEFEFAAPFGFHDLFALRVRPTPSFRDEKQSIYLKRVQCKRWADIWPRLRIEAESDDFL
jgi:hypothetical protein